MMAQTKKSLNSNERIHNEIAKIKIKKPITPSGNAVVVPKDLGIGMLRDMLDDGYEVREEDKTESISSSSSSSFSQRRAEN